MLIPAVAVAAVLVGAAGATVPRSGLHGVLLRAPITPVCREGVRCHAPAPHVRLSFVAARATRTVTTDAAGRYAVALAPGTYAVRVALPLAHVRPASVVVRAGAQRLQNLVLDTGIR